MMAMMSPVGLSKKVGDSFSEKLESDPGGRFRRGFLFRFQRQQKSRDCYNCNVTSTVLDPIPNGAAAGTSPSQKRVLLLKPRGFCAGVVRAIDIVRIALETFGAPIYVRREIVHNRYVVNELAEKGAIFVHEIDDVPDGQRVIYSAHGVSPAVRERSKGRGLRVIDATCPLVTKVHIEAVKFAKQGYSLILIGHRDHDEIEGTLGE